MSRAIIIQITLKNEGIIQCDKIRLHDGLIYYDIRNEDYPHILNPYDIISIEPAIEEF